MVSAEPLLMVCQRIPYPPSKGDKLRSWNFLRRFAADRPVHLTAFIDDPADLQWQSFLEEVCASVLLLRLHPLWARAKSLPALLGDRPLSLPYFHHQAMHSWANDIRRRHAIRQAYVFSSAVAPVVLGPEWKDVRRVVDMVDVDSDKWRQYADGLKGLGRWIYNREATTLAAFEEAVARQADATLLISESESAHLQRRVPDVAGKIHTIPNGIDTDFFDPTPSFPNPFSEQKPAIVFTGAMDYWPNVEAVTWFAEHVFPQLRQARPDAWFHIVGANPTAAVKQLVQHPHINVTGRVEAIQPYIAHADVIVAPVRIARGVQNKVLEGMAMARPVITTGKGLEGLSAIPGQHLFVADEPAEYLQAISDILTAGADEIGIAARAFVQQTYDWDSAYATLAGLIDNTTTQVPGNLTSRRRQAVS